MQQSKNRSAAIDFHDAVRSHVSSDLWKKTGRTNVASARNEHDAVAVADSETARGLATLDLFARKTFRSHSLHRNAAIGRSFGGRDHKGSPFRGLIDPRHLILSLVRSERLQHFSAAD